MEKIMSGSLDYILEVGRQQSKKAAETSLDSSLASAFLAANKIENAEVRGQVVWSRPAPVLPRLKALGPDAEQQHHLA
jgi:hypothetical protein